VTLIVTLHLGLLWDMISSTSVSRIRVSVVSQLLSILMPDFEFKYVISDGHYLWHATGKNEEQGILESEISGICYFSR
jgi:hypothetical protein